METHLKKNLSISLLLVLIFSACSESEPVKADFHVVPLPQEISETGADGFILDSGTKIQYIQGDEAQKRNAEFLVQYINQVLGFTPQITYEKVPKNVIVLQSDYSSDKNGAYTIDVEAQKIIINGQDQAGVFYGIQTLRKSMAGIAEENKRVLFPSVNITDYPRFDYRGMHLDVARHMFTIEEVKTFIDILALHNINVFHWHLTDDQGWRIEIKSHPELTKTGAYRTETVIGRNTGKYDGTPHGGFFTQEEIKDIIAYAGERYITVIPEVDLPGHMLAALACYPELGCTGGPYEVEKTWGIFEDVLCAGNDSIYSFLEDVFSEVIMLFPAEYIHIGGDECPKTRWEKCPKCQAKIKELGLKADSEHTAEQYLQSYVMQRMEKFINEKGRRIIGWDEILEGGVAPNATVMSWQGIEGGITAARLGHDVIMVPTSYLYFDYYQSKETGEEPLGIGGYVPVEKVYSFEPMPEELTAEQQRHILGVQANLWSEYVVGGEHMQYMLLPRMGALSEIQWLEPEKKDYNDFLLREFRMTKLYDQLGYTYAKHIFNIQAEVKPDFVNKEALITFSTPDNVPVYYTLDGTEPTSKDQLYGHPFSVKENADIKAIAIRENGNNSRVLSRVINVNKATFKNITLENEPAPRFTYDGAPILVDGMKGGQVYRGGDWLGFWKDDMIVTVDLEGKTEISKVKIGAFLDVWSWVFTPTELQVWISDDNKTFNQVFVEKYPEIKEDEVLKEIRSYEAAFDPVQVSYVKIIAKTLKSLPAWHGGAGKPGHLFVDEIEIY